MDIAPVGTGPIPSQKTSPGTQADAFPAEPSDTFVGPSPGEASGINVNTAMQIMNRGIALRPVWQLKMDDACFFSDGRPDFPAPVMSGKSIFLGGNRSYQRIDQATGEKDWEVRLENGESFSTGDPVIAGHNLICLVYSYPLDASSSRDGVCAIDAKTGEVKFKTKGDHLICRPRTDREGNIYYGTFTGKIMRITPRGEETQLNHEGWYDHLLAMEVTPDGTVYYAKTLSDKILKIEGGHETSMKVEGKIRRFWPGPHGKVYCTSEQGKEQILTCLNRNGKALWKKRYDEKYTIVQVAPDGRVFALHPGNREKDAVLDCISPGGKDQWHSKLDDPQLHSGWWWSNGHLKTGSGGEITLIEPHDGKMVTLAPDGKERWRYVPEKSMLNPLFTFAPGEKLYILERGGMHKVNLSSGMEESEYSYYDKKLVTHEPGKEPVTQKITASEPFYFRGMVLEKDETHLFTFDSEGKFSLVEMPGDARALATKAASEVIPKEGSDEIEDLEGFVRIGGVMLPVRQSS